MAEAVESLLGDRLTGGVVNILKGTEGKYHVKQVKLVGASHPVPNEAGCTRCRGDALNSVRG